MSTKTRSNRSAHIYKIERRTFLQVCEALNTPRALAAYLLVKHDEGDQYLALNMPDPDSPTFADDYLVTEMLKKNPHLPTSFDPLKEAKNAWHAAEQSCREANERLGSFSQGGFAPLDSNIPTVIRRAQDLLLSWLGPLRREDLDFVESNMRFGPGATSSVSGKNVLECKKYTCSMHVTPRLYPYWHAIRTYSKDVELRAYSEVTFVPKTAKTHRAIAVEPHMNIFVQLGCGALIRKRLKRLGLDLDRQADVNRRLASQAHLRNLATVDLSSASDTISRELVWLLLPFEWASLLDLSRTEYSALDGVEYRLEKFSSMGNGYTFELETLLFLALTRACGDANAVTFGDDIICSRDTVPLLESVLTFCGFRFNQKKTFVAGRFFESCGCDYRDGVMVRPFYLKGDYHDTTSCAIRVSNKIRRYSNSRNRGLGCDIRFLRPWLGAVNSAPLARETCISDGYGDDGVIKNFDEATPPRARFGHDGYIGRVYRPQPGRYDASAEVGGLAGVLHRPLPPSSGSVKSLVSRRGHCITPKALGKQVVPVWHDLGPWV